jgi:acylpyruvate hydrolase
VMRAGIRINGNEIEDAKIEVGVEESRSSYTYAET